MQTSQASTLSNPASEHAPGKLSATGLRKSYGGRMVVQDVSISVNSGEVVGLLGPNGAGKTTSFYMIVGLVAADAGRIEIDDIPISSMPIHRRARMGLSYLPQDASVFRRLTVEQNIRAVLELQIDNEGKKFSTSTIERQLDSLLEELQITHIRKNSALSLSGGERRRVEISRALATRPRFILLDEPFAALGPALRRDMLDLVKAMQQARHMTVIMVTHQPEDAHHAATHTAYLENGRILALRPTADLFAATDLPGLDAYLGDSR